MPSVNNARPAMMKIPTTKYLVGIDSLRYEPSCNIVFTLADLVDRSKCHEIALIQYGDLVRHSTSSVYIMCHNDHGCTALCFATYKQLVDFSSRYAVEAATWFISEKYL